MWQEAFEALMAEVAGRFARVEPRRRARAFVLGLQRTAILNRPAREPSTGGHALNE
ncbi:hypothetical protein [Streptomyces toxytricini]|uniref:hypothetical protein n=1 Tax=Streptomyces toxytricini TaxID=67369 RepID=UPI0034363AA9